MTQPKTAEAAGSRMSYWIATALRARRTNAGVAESDVATALGVNWRTIRRLEEGRSMGRDIDRFVSGYAYVLGIDDPRAIWTEALDLWKREGSATPLQTTSGPAAAFAEAIRSEALRQLARGRSEQKSKRRASR